MFHRQQLQQFHSPIQRALKSAILNWKEEVHVTTRVGKEALVKRSSQQKLKKEAKKQKLTPVDIDQQLGFLKRNREKEGGDKLRFGHNVSTRPLSYYKATVTIREHGLQGQCARNPSRKTETACSSRS
jgi:hypothetical protein